MIARARLVETDPSSTAELRDGARVIAEQGRRMTAIIRNLLDFARPSQPQVRPEDLRAIATKTRDLLGPLARRRDVQIEASGEPVVATVDAEQVLQGVTNLV